MSAKSNLFAALPQHPDANGEKLDPSGRAHRPSSVANSNSRYAVKLSTGSYLSAYYDSTGIEASPLLTGAKLFCKRQTADAIAVLFDGSVCRTVLINGVPRIAILEPSFVIPKPTIDEPVLSPIQKFILGEKR